MRLKKGIRIFLTVIAILIVSLFIIWYLFFSDKKVAKKVKVLNNIKEYRYELKDSHSKEYKSLFYDLKKILGKDTVDYKEYASTIGKMFIIDYYSLSDRIAKTDVGGVCFVHSAAVSNFLEKSENTIYKYLESNLYGGREQKLPKVKEVIVDSVEVNSFEYLDTVDEEAYFVKLHWNYTDLDSSSGYQREAELVFVHEEKKLSLVEVR